MMIYECKICEKEISLAEINFEGNTFCQCGGQELQWKGTRKGHVQKDTLAMIIEGIKDHYK